MNSHIRQKQLSNALNNNNITSATAAYKISSCPTIDLGSSILTKDQLSEIKLGLCIVDSSGICQSIYSKNYKNRVTHNNMANALKKIGYIDTHYFRVAENCNGGGGYGFYLRHIYDDNNRMPDKMAVALYNGIESQTIENGASTFEQKLAYLGDFGYSIKYSDPIYDQNAFTENLQVLSSVLGHRFDKRFFVEQVKDSARIRQARLDHDWRTNNY